MNRNIYRTAYATQTGDVFRRAQGTAPPPADPPAQRQEADILWAAYALECSLGGSEQERRDAFARARDAEDACQAAAGLVPAA
jgi:hypothetical protein